MMKERRKRFLWFGSGVGCGVLALVLYFVPHYSFTVGELDLVPLAAMLVNSIGLACVGWATCGFTNGNVPTNHH